MALHLIAAEAANSLSAVFPTASNADPSTVTDAVKSLSSDVADAALAVLAAIATWLAAHSGALFVRILGKKLGDKAQVLFEDRLNRALAFAQAQTGKAIADLNEDDLVHAIVFLRNNFSGAVGKIDSERQSKSDDDLMASLKASVAQAAGGEAVPQFAPKPEIEQPKPKRELTPAQLAALKAIIATLDPPDSETLSAKS